MEFTLRAKFQSFFISLALTIGSALGIIVLIWVYNFLNLNIKNFFMGILLDLLALYGLYLSIGISRSKNKGFHIDHDSIFSFVIGVPLAIFVERMVDNQLGSYLDVFWSIAFIVALITIFQNYIDMFMKKYMYFKFITKLFTYILIILCIFFVENYRLSVLDIYTGIETESEALFIMHESSVWIYENVF